MLDSRALIYGTGTGQSIHRDATFQPISQFINLYLVNMSRVGFVFFTQMSGHRDSSAPWLQGQIQPNIYQPQYHIYDRLSTKSEKGSIKDHRTKVLG